VIFDHPKAGIALFVVRDIKRDLPSDLSDPGQREKDKLKPHTYHPVHEPYEDNYSHTEIAVVKDGKRVTKSSSIGELAKKEFRQIISDRSLVLLQPKPNDPIADDVVG
jgi:hypothetical protein